MKRRILADEWNSYARAVIPNDVSDVQREEMRNTFYAGALGVFNALVVNLSKGPDVQPEDLERMADLNAELKEFGEEFTRRLRDGIA